jgi:hypothetical protein
MGCADNEDLFKDGLEATNPRCRDQNGVSHLPVPLTQLQIDTTSILLQIDKNVLVLDPKQLATR